MPSPCAASLQPDLHHNPRSPPLPSPFHNHTYNHTYSHALPNLNSTLYPIRYVIGFFLLGVGYIVMALSNSTWLALLGWWILLFGNAFPAVLGPALALKYAMEFGADEEEASVQTATLGITVGGAEVVTRLRTRSLSVQPLTTTCPQSSAPLPAPRPSALSRIGSPMMSHATLPYACAYK